MPILLVQLSDLHATDGSEPIFKRWDAVLKTVQAELDDTIEACVIVFGGDAAFGGKEDQFSLASGLLTGLKTHLTFVKPDLPVHILVVPGNHDCDLTSEDLEARITLRAKTSNQMPASSTARFLLGAQRDFFEFSKLVNPDGAAFSLENPFYRHFDLVLKRTTVRFHLLNSSWTSIIHENDDLRFPLEAFTPPATDAHFAVGVIHHPPHWFLMPSVRRELRDLLETNCDLLLTGHEHENESSRRLVKEGGEIAYLEGGVLSDTPTSDLCLFNTVRLDFESQTQLVKRHAWDTDHFELDAIANPSPLDVNRFRIDRKFRLRAQFEEWLDELEDPLTHPRQEDLRLSHLFSYPDLRRITQVADGGESKPSEVIDRIKSGDVFGELSQASRALVGGGDRAGKTSLLKRLFADLHRLGRVPLFLRGTELPKSGNTEHLRKQIMHAVEQQYQYLTPAAFEQVGTDLKVLLVDDFHDAPSDAGARRKILDAIGGRFKDIALTASDDLFIELLNRRTGEDISQLIAYQRYEIGDFGRQRLEELALRWTSIGRGERDPAELRSVALDLCDKVQSLLTTAGLPHTPWLLVVILEHDESPDATIAAKNGDYGHLYHAVITVRLAKSKFSRFNLSGKFTYLSELAYHLFKKKQPVLNDAEARKFHADHCAKFDLTLAFEQVRDDLVDTRMLRLDGDEVAFRQTYVFSFFVAYWLSRNIHRPEATNVIRELTQRLHHEVSANVLVFLSHLTDNPIVLDEMRAAAAKFFESAKPATVENDVEPLNKLPGVEGFFALPSTAPDVNRKLLQELEDDAAAKRRDRQLHDGRLVRVVPNGDEQDIREELHATLNDVRGALRTIRILGQVLRNKAFSTEGPEKLSLMQEVFGVQRRLLGFLFHHLKDLRHMVMDVRKRLMPVLVRSKVKENIEKARAAGGSDKDAEAGKLRRAELRDLWREAGIMSSRFWFETYWMATFGLTKRVANAIGSKDLESTLNRLRATDPAIPIELVDLVVRLNRRTPHIPVDEIVRLHKKLNKAGNKVARVVLEAVTWERLLLIDTDQAQKQAVCKQMDIEVPVQSLNPSRKKFGKRR